MSEFSPRQVRKESFRFPSRDGHTELHALSWVPSGEVRALVHVCHGLNEYMEHFDAFGHFLAEQGFLVFGHDLLGHGLSAEYDEDLGFFGSSRGDDYVLADILTLSRTLREAYPDKPLFLLGQGMGSYFVRRYLFTWPEEAGGAILIATGGLRLWQAQLKRLGLAVSGFFRNERYRPKRRWRREMRDIRPAHRSMYPWLARPTRQFGMDKKDPYVSFVPTLKLYQDLNHTLGLLARDEKVIDMRKDCPVFILYGADDPISEGADEPKRLASLYKQAGLEYVSFKGYYHESLDAEAVAREVEEDILMWLEASLGMA